MNDGLTGEGFAQGLGQGFLDIWQGIGGSLISTNNYNNAVAAQIGANAAATPQMLQAQAEARRNQQRTLAIIFIVVALLPILALFLIKRK